MHIHHDDRPLRVLLVDDDSIVLELVAIMLAAKGTEVQRALGGQQALDTLNAALKTRSSLPDVVLVDHQMPGISGSDVGRHIRSMAMPRPRVVAMSASPLPDDELVLFDDFLAKPIDRDLLRAAVTGSAAVEATPGASMPARGLPPALDASTVRKLQAIMPPHAIHELYSVYVADTRQRIDDLERFSATGDEESLRRCAHNLKGAAAMAGVSGVAAIAAGLESGDLRRQEHKKLFLEMRNACDDVERSMTMNVTTTGTSGEAR